MRQLAAALPSPAATKLNSPTSDATRNHPKNLRSETRDRVGGFTLSPKYAKL